MPKEKEFEIQFGDTSMNINSLITLSVIIIGLIASWIHMEAGLEAVSRSTNTNLEAIKINATYHETILDTIEKVDNKNAESIRYLSQRVDRLLELEMQSRRDLRNIN